VVLTTEQYLALYPGWGAGQDELGRLSRNSLHRLVGPASEHFVAWQHPDVVITAVNQVLSSARTRTPLE
jgi:hypothetical protein